MKNAINDLELAKKVQLRKIDNIETEVEQLAKDTKANEERLKLNQEYNRKTTKELVLKKELVLCHIDQLDIAIFRIGGK